jgi:hypothetical protein
MRLPLGFTRYETVSKADSFIFAWRSGERQEFQVKDGPFGPPPKAVLRILELKFLSRIIAPAQSMKRWRCGQRNARSIRKMQSFR